MFCDFGKSVKKPRKHAYPSFLVWRVMQRTHGWITRLFIVQVLLVKTTNDYKTAWCALFDKEVEFGNSLAHKPKIDIRILLDSGNHHPVAGWHAAGFVVVLSDDELHKGKSGGAEIRGGIKDRFGADNSPRGSGKITGRA